MARLFREVGDAPLFPAGSVVAIGAFDGVHLGHQRLLADALASAQRLRLPSVALSFEPLPREYFASRRGDEPPARLTPARMKFELLRDAGMASVGLLRFNEALALMEAERFVEDILVAGLRTRAVCVGPDFRFGKARRGDVGLLARMGGELGFEVEVAGEVRDVAGVRIGATVIRQALAEGRFALARAALGRPYSISGRVIRGRQLGRRLGFPTANIAVRWEPAVQGILAVRVFGEGLDGWPGVASLGTRPTVGGGPAVLEAHLFDFDGDLYGRHLRVEFIEHLRDERRFDTLDVLTAQMRDDAARARAVLAAPATLSG
jgi:riboflavin kinase/FMN adenylyltransferase